MLYDRGVGKASPCYADGMLYPLGERGSKAGLAPASTKGMKPTGSATVKGCGPSWVHPVVPTENPVKPVPYFHVVFTVPQQLRDLIRRHQTTLYPCPPEKSHRRPPNR